MNKSQKKQNEEIIQKNKEKPIGRELGKSSISPEVVEESEKKELLDDLDIVKKLISRIEPKITKQISMSFCCCCLFFICLVGIFVGIFFGYNEYLRYCVKNSDVFYCNWIKMPFNEKKSESKKEQNCSEKFTIIKKNDNEYAYQCCLLNNKFHGQKLVKRKYNFSLIYWDEFKNNRYHGYGSLFQNNQTKGIFLNGNIKKRLFYNPVTKKKKYSGYKEKGILHGENEQIIYKRFFKNGFPNFKGTFYTNLTNFTKNYSEMHKYGVSHGRGILYMNNNEIKFRGIFIQGKKFIGKRIIRKKNRTLYRGGLMFPKKHRNGIEYDKNEQITFNEMKEDHVIKYKDIQDFYRTEICGIEENMYLDN